MTALKITLAGLALAIAANSWLHLESVACEKQGGTYARTLNSWSYQCIPNN